MTTRFDRIRYEPEMMSLKKALTPPAPNVPARRWRVRRLAVASSVVSSSLLVSMVLAFQCRPAWYDPVAADEEVIRRAQRESAAAVDETSRQLVRRKPFEVTISQQQINEWLAALPQLWPHWGERLPKEVGGLAVELEHDRVRVGALVERGGVRVVANGGLRIELTPDGKSVRLQLEDLRGGRLPVPRGLLRTVRGMILGPEEQGGNDGTNLLDLMEGLEIPNAFVWPNGERDFRLQSVRIAPEGVFLTLEPRP